MNKIILSLFDYSCTWSKPYADAGYTVVPIDIQRENIDLANTHGYEIAAYIIGDILERPASEVVGILAAVPCTEFACSGAKHFAAKDADGRTEKARLLWKRTMEIIHYFRNGADFDIEEIRQVEPEAGLKFWAIENPVGRVNSLMPEMKNFGPWYFQPCDYGDPYTKKTGLWGEFNRDLRQNPVEPTLGSKMHKVPPGPERQNIRSQTPEGFARAFFEANQ
tara:strand:+ start:323 stop:985 length:663 start_codon:yes stop_codon:yes gene_type:complete